jgi:hypothetical protein
VTTPQPPRERQDLARLLDRLARLWAAGATLAQIERSTGMSRGVAIGRIHRARKAGDPRFRPRLKAPKPKPKVRRLKPPGEEVGNRHRVPAPAPPPPEPPRPQLLVDLELRRWPVGERDGKHTFCGRPAIDRSPYCAAHCHAVRGESTRP